MPSTMRRSDRAAAMPRTKLSRQRAYLASCLERDHLERNQMDSIIADGARGMA